MMIYNQPNDFEAFEACDRIIYCSENDFVSLENNYKNLSTLLWQIIFCFYIFFKKTTTFVVAVIF